jgi:hypothetical protein
MTKLSISIIAVIYFCLQQQMTHERQKIKPVLIDLMFQDYFKNDTLSLKINNISIVNKIMLTSNTAGFTILNIKLSQQNASQLKIDFLDKYKYCRSSGKIKLVIVLNGKVSQINIDCHNGKFIGLNKNDDNTFYIKQQKNPFMYD